VLLGRFEQFLTRYLPVQEKAKTVKNHAKILEE
jgi:hypothetical protein